MALRSFSSPSSTTLAKATNRLSAVYIGPHIPDLPGPPSPSGSSEGSASGLPSPPATNSTGSGGDSDLKEKEDKDRALSSVASPQSSVLETHSRRGHKLSSSVSSVASISISSVVVPKGASILEETLPLAEMDEEEEETTRFSTLQRVKSLKDRNRLVLDKLVLSGTHSPAPSTSSSSSRRSYHSQTMSPLQISSPHSRSNSTSSPHDPRSGSETERESTYSRASSTHHRAFSLATSTPQHEQLRTQTHRSSVPSTPSSRNESRSRDSAASGSGSSSRRRLALLEDGTARLRERAEEILDRTKRDSPGTAVKKRGALPAEFRKTSTELPPYQDSSSPLRAPSLTHTASHPSASASTSTSQSKASKSRYSLDLASQSSRSSHSRSTYSHSHSQSYSSSSQSQSQSQSQQPQSQSQSQTNTPNHNHAHNRTYTYTRTHTPSPSASTLPAPTPRAQTSSDTRNAAAATSATSTAASRRAAGTPILGMTAYRERRQTLRGGSAESALSNRGPGGVAVGMKAGKRTLIGEELRAAGLSPSRSRAGRGRLSLGWEGEEEAVEARAFAGERAVTSLSIYGERGGEGERSVSVREMSLVRDRERERRREERERERVARERERELRERERSVSRARDVSRDRDLVTPDRERERERERDATYTPSPAFTRLRTTTASTATTTTTTAATPSPFGSRRHAPTGSSHSHSHTEHTRLLGESLNMFEGHFSRLCGGAGGDTVKSAQSVVGVAARLNEMLRAGTARALEEQVRAEVEGFVGREEEVWGRVGAEYREGLKMSDELVRGLTGLLLGFGRAVRESGGGGGGGEGIQHGRSVSLDEEGLVGGGRIRARGRGSMSPEVSVSNGGGISTLVGMGIGSNKSGPGSSGAGSGGAHSVSAGGSVSGSGRRSVESRSSWDANATLALRDDVSRRLMARAESALGAAGMSRPGTAFSTLRDRERERSVETPPQQAPPSTTRRLFTPREQREMQMSASNHTPGSAGLGGGGMPTIHSQETLYGEYEPSPTPASRITMNATNATMDRSRTLPPLGIPKPLPSLPSETALRRNGTLVEKSAVNMNPDTAASAGTVRDREREMRKVSIASTSTVRGGTSASSSAFPVTAPAGATTAVTAHTVSTQTPGRTAFPSLPRTDSDRSVRSSVTFSRASTVSSVSALVDVRRQDTRRRTESGNLDPSASDPLPPVSATPVPALVERQRAREVQSGSETERPRPPRRTQVGKMTLDAKGKGTGTGHAQDRSAVVAANAIVAAKMGINGGRGLQPSSSGVGVVKKERRRTITDIWPQD